jgi:putative transposase
VAKFWMDVLAELKNRGLKDVLIACMDGLTGFPEAVRAVYPDTRVQLCIVHMVRNSTKFVSYKDLKKVCADLKTIYSAPTEESGRAALEEFRKTWDGKYPMICQSWDRRWDDLSEFFKYPDEIRRAIYTTNAIESLNYQLRKVTKNCSTFSTDDAIFKILYLAVRNASEKYPSKLPLLPLDEKVKKLLKIDYPPPKVVALRRFYGYATVIFKMAKGIAYLLTTALGGGFKK